jgi:L-alanine-DL-glutamate epimerase-like enolase superfamily enzyme
MKLHYIKKELPFEYPFTISGGRTKTHQSILMVVLELGNWYGVGEAPAISYYNVTVDDMIADIEKNKKLIEQFAFTDPERYWHYLHHLLPNNPFLVCALDMAGWDLYGKMKKKLLHELWETPWRDNLPTTDYTIGIDTIDNMIAKVKAKPWGMYKLKVGMPQDIELVNAIRQHTDVPLRVDANGGWTLDEAIEKIPQLKELGVQLVEQPLHKDKWDDMKVLYQQSALPLLADEGCVSEQDVKKCVGHFHGINIKLTKCSGITPALRMIKEARQIGLTVMMGNMNESSIGSAAIAQFLPQLDYVDVDGPLLLTNDLATGLQIEPSMIQVAGKTGLGITLI